MGGDVFDLPGVHVRKGERHCGGQIDDGLLLRRRAPDVQHRVDHLERILRLGGGEALGRILQTVVAARPVRELFQKHCPVDGDFFDLRLRFVKDLLALHGGGRVIHMHDRALCARDGLERAADDVLARGREDLDGHARGDELFVDEAAHELELRIRRGGKTDLDFTKADLHQEIEKSKLL